MLPTADRYGYVRSMDMLETLTPRETEVLVLMSRGYSNPQIARTLVITLHTVKVHIAHILAKLGARNRTDAVVRAIQMGYVARRQAMCAPRRPLQGLRVQTS